ncbi:GNAT family N-acetyltransferase [Amycolatopsis magusensis]|uniref:GNAT family N-acetyltransferase n=1 Tax=Amycolatopsis magusensis TaxID=882444 RepID=UPI0024A8FE24|nr:GNAT family N-acetyltransferase [Amycolatopsis magusensis]MDI5980746.1 GNAT family N-acetyltransferase [Amycolatopsis magusensis]
MTEQAGDVTVTRDEAGSRYQVFVGDRVAGFAAYREEGEQTVFTHTEVGVEFGGQGLGKVLAAGALDDTVRRGRTIVPLCPFIAKFLQRTEGYEEHVDWNAHR